MAKPPTERDILPLLQELIRARTVNPPGNEVRAAEVVEAYLEERGVEVRTLEPEEDRANLYAEVGSGKTLVLNGHLDVVPPGRGWRRDPFEPTVEGDRVYGRGATDMKGGVAAAVAAFASLAEEPPGRIKLLLTADEERGSRLGMGWIVEHMPELAKGDFAIVLEPMGSYPSPKFIAVAEKGVVIAHIHVYGRSAHSSVPQLGENAIMRALRLSERLLRERPKGGWRPGVREALSYVLAAGERRRLGLRGALAMYRALRDVTVNVAKINGGEKTNLVPDHCEVVVSYRIFPGQGPEDVEDCIRRAMRREGVRGDVVVTTYIEGSRLRGGEEWVDTLSETVKSVYGTAPIKILSVASSDARFFRNRLGVPAVQFGPGESHLAHAPNEYVHLRDVVSASRVLVEFAEKTLRA